MADFVTSSGRRRTPPVVVMDYPAAWAYVRDRAVRLGTDEHDPLCSFRQTNGAMLCDCEVLWSEYERRGGTRP